jgi:hypothetical protein
MVSAYLLATWLTFHETLAALCEQIAAVNEVFAVWVLEPRKEVFTITYERCRCFQNRKKERENNLCTFLLAS